MNPILITIPTFNRLKATQETLASLATALKGLPYLLYIVDNASVDGTANWILGGSGYGLVWESTVLPANVGQAKAVNAGWAKRMAGQHCIRLDNDFTVADANWIQDGLQVFAADAKIGVITVKWEGNQERPDHSSPMYHSYIYDVGGIEVEESQFPISPAMLVRGELIDAIGGFNQPGLYGYDDLLYLRRAQLAGYKTVFLPNAGGKHLTPLRELDHTTYGAWKRAVADRDMHAYGNMLAAYAAGESLYVPLEQNYARA